MYNSCVCPRSSSSCSSQLRAHIHTLAQTHKNTKPSRVHAVSKNPFLLQLRHTGFPGAPSYTEMHTERTTHTHSLTHQSAQACARRSTTISHTHTHTVQSPCRIQEPVPLVVQAHRLHGHARDERPRLKRNQHTHTYTHTHARTHTHAHTHTHTHTHTYRPSHTKRMRARRAQNTHTHTHTHRPESMLYPETRSSCS